MNKRKDSTGLLMTKKKNLLFSLKKHRVRADMKHLLLYPLPSSTVHVLNRLKNGCVLFFSFSSLLSFFLNKNLGRL